MLFAALHESACGPLADAPVDNSRGSFRGKADIGRPSSGIRTYRQTWYFDTTPKGGLLAALIRRAGSRADVFHS
jgi:hypothetical protein